MEKMKYQDKVKFVEQSIELLKNNKSRAEVADYLSAQGLKKWDIDKINQSIDNQLRHEHKAKIKSYMLENSLEAKLSEFEDVDADLFEAIQYEIIAEIEQASKKKVQQLFAQGKDQEEIIQKVKNTHFDEEDILAVVELEKEKKQEKESQHYKGIGFIILGIILTFASFNINTGGVVLFYGLIIYGIILLVRNK
ncbi:MAG: hypothetical protein AAF985_23490 [Bacteroidota bacterium]